MNTTVSTTEELAKAIDRGENKIIVTGTLGEAVITIEAIGPVAWAVAIGAVGVAVASIITTVGTGGVGAPAGVVMKCFTTPVLVTTFGSTGTVTTAVSIAVAGGGVGTLTTLRKYKAKRERGKVVLIRH